MAVVQLRRGRIRLDLTRRDFQQRVAPDSSITASAEGNKNTRNCDETDNVARRGSALTYRPSTSTTSPCPLMERTSSITSLARSVQEGVVDVGKQLQLVDEQQAFTCVLVSRPGCALD